MNPHLSSALNIGLGLSLSLTHFLYHRRFSNTSTSTSSTTDSTTNSTPTISSSTDSTTIGNSSGDGEGVECKIFYASQTGTAEKYSRILAQRLSQVGQIRPLNLEDVDGSEFGSQRALFLFLIATHYDGLFPDNCNQFIKILKGLVKSGAKLDDVLFCIFGLGSSDYDYFNKAAKDLRDILVKLHSVEFHPIYLCDELNGVDKEFEKWFGGLVKPLNSLLKVELKWDSLEDKFLKSWRYHCGLELRYNSNLKTEFKVVPNDIVCKQQYQCVECKVTGNYNLIPECEDVVHHVELEYCGDYGVSDTAYVLYRNPKHTVDFFMDRLNLTEDDLGKEITFVPRHGNVNDELVVAPPFPVPVKIKDALELYCDLTSLPRDDELLLLTTLIKDRRGSERVRKAVNNRKMMGHIREEVKLTLEEFILLFFPNEKLNLSGFLQLVPKQVPKPYTISSFSEGGGINLTVKFVKYNLHSLRTFYKTNLKRGLFNELGFDELSRRRVYLGNCTRFLCHLEPGDVVPLFIRPSSLSKIDLTGDLLLIANGTGIAAFRPIWQLLSTKPKSGVSEIVMILGFKTDRHVLYKEELERLRDVKILYAFSRVDKHWHVQDVVKENVEEIKDLMAKRAPIVLCGGKRMGNEVRMILSHYANLDLDLLKQQHLFHEELY